MPSSWWRRLLVVTFVGFAAPPVLGQTSTNGSIRGFVRDPQQALMPDVTSYTHQWRHVAGTWQPNDPASFIQPDAFPNSRGLGSVTSTFETQNSRAPRSSPSGSRSEHVRMSFFK